MKGCHIMENCAYLAERANAFDKYQVNNEPGEYQTQSQLPYNVTSIVYATGQLDYIIAEKWYIKYTNSC